MSTARLRRLLSTQCLAWWIGALLLSALQPFIAVHFRSDGWEDEPGFRIRPMSQTTQFEQDGRLEHAREHETTLFVPLGAGAQSSHAFADVLGAFTGLLALVLALAVPRIAPALRLAMPPRHRPCPRGGPPPPSAPRRARPPALAPPPVSC
ncbi:hypothetical protein DBA29_09805 [Xenophilus aerolatus]|nr:hypothetical protein [Xenophilus aerolatus]